MSANWFASLLAARNVDSSKPIFHTLYSVFCFSSSFRFFPLPFSIFSDPIMVSPRKTRSRNSLQPDQVSELKRLIKESRDVVINTLKEDINFLKQKFDSLTLRLSEMEASVLSIERNQDNLKSEISSVRMEMDSTIADANRLCSSEMDNRISRTNNIVIRGLPEESGMIAERTARDKAVLEEVFDILNVEAGVVDVRRLGKPNKNRPRLLRVSLSNICHKQEILRKSKSLKSSRFQNIFIQPDFTPMQQVIEQKLREELKRRRENGEDVVIHGGVVRLRSELQGFRK